MAEITVRRRGELVRGVFQLLLDRPDGLPAKDVLERLRSVVPPTPFEDSEYPNRPGVRRYTKIVRFSTIPAVKAGWLTKEKGQWTLSDAGRAAFERYRDPEQFEREARRLYRQWAEAQPSEAEEEDASAPSTAVATLEEAEETAWQEIQDYLMGLAPSDFQDLVTALLRGGTGRPRLKVQVKRRQDRIAVDGLRSFLALLGDQDVGLFVATGGFTKEAEAEARRQERRQITLLDLKRLFDLWVEYRDRIPEQGRQMLPLKPVYFLAPKE